MVRILCLIREWMDQRGVNDRTACIYCFVLYLITGNYSAVGSCILITHFADLIAPCSLSVCTPPPPPLSTLPSVNLPTFSATLSLPPSSCWGCCAHIRLNCIHLVGLDKYLNVKVNLLVRCYSQQDGRVFAGQRRRDHGNVLTFNTVSLPPSPPLSSHPSCRTIQEI